MKIIYYYNNTCKCCKDYIETVMRLGEYLLCSVVAHDIDVTKPSYEIKGIPTVIIVDDNDNILYQNTGNLKFEFLKDDVRKNMKR